MDFNEISSLIHKLKLSGEKKEKSVLLNTNLTRPSKERTESCLIGKVANTIN